VKPVVTVEIQDVGAKVRIIYLSMDGSCCSWCEDALFHARLNDWRLFWEKGDWKNICPECREVEGK